MIITDISAQNLLKYHNLQLHDLPEKGVIGISGLNESGKSTIGETICFALFGRTFSLQSEELEKVINWGEARCSAVVRFRTGDGGHYEIARFLDRDGNHGVRLNRVGHEEPLARGVEPVDNHMYDLLGYGYEEFIDSFYLAQREITTPHPHSHAVKTMAGITTLEYVSYEYEQEIDEQQQAIAIAEEEVASLDQELDELGIDEGELAALEADRTGESEAETRSREELAALEQALEETAEAIPAIRSARKSRGRAGLLRTLAFLVALLLAAAWLMLVQLPDHPVSGRLGELLRQQVPAWNESSLPLLLYAAAALLVLSLVFWIRGAAGGRRARRMQEVTGGLTGLLEALHRRVPVGDSPVEREENEAAQEEGGRPSDAEVAELCRRIPAAAADPVEVRTLVNRELAWLRDDQAQRQKRIAELDRSIWRENDRLRKGESLNKARTAFVQEITEQKRRIHLRELGQELLLATSRYLSQRFNRDLRDLVSRTLPMFTENRYEHLQIDDDLSVRVFSTEKRDFLDLEEISSGTQRQIMLAVRLALSQELVNGTQGGRQFIFLDEPFAFFDRERTRSSLNVLPQLSEEITQVWIVAQEFPEGFTFDRILNCDRNSEAITWEG